MHPLLGLISLSTFARGGVTSMYAKTVEGDEVALLCHLGRPGSPESPAATSDVVFTFDDVSLESFMATWDRLGERPQASYARNMAVGLIGHSPAMVEEHIGHLGFR